MKDGQGHHRRDDIFVAEFGQHSTHSQHHGRRGTDVHELRTGEQTANGVPTIRALKPKVGLTPANMAEAIASGTATRAIVIAAPISAGRFLLSKSSRAIISIIYRQAEYLFGLKSL